MLTPRKRITKKQLKEDKLITYTVKAKDWLDENLKYVTGGVAAVVIIIVAIFMFSTSRKNAEAATSVELANAMHVYESRDYTNAVNLLTNIVNKNKSTKSGKLARYYLAQSLYKRGEYSAAQEHFRKFATSFQADEYLKIVAMAGEAACLEQQDRFADAAVKYENIGKRYPDSPRAARYYLRAARCYALAGNSSKAQETYQLIIKNYPDSQEKNDAVLYSALE
ncbi:hypothetical protein EH223_04310 [candidate division KSB1 bacterium]|nr:tetratricopeptide repeat protein [candidate division KSB1 bacterium]RQW05507.1 MAG: hypothetical protein EH223_04310 [candidate division KSB1 bacterium]